MSKVRVGIIGAGNIGSQHIETLRSELSHLYEITAICARNDSGEAKELGAGYFYNYQDVISSGLCDALIVSTPTYSHKEIGEATLKAGLHLLMEKPIGLSVQEGEELIQSQKPGQKFAVMLNQRHAPAYAMAKKIISDGVLGKLVRFQWIMTNWFRPDIYFLASDWRGTWRGEGGGLLLNQCIHNLDILQWLVGLPKSISASCSFGKYHPIEVEDEAVAQFHYSDGLTGMFVGSTGETPGRNDLEIIGTDAALVFNGDKLLLRRNEVPVDKFCRETKDMFGEPEFSIEELDLPDLPNQHAKVLENFANSILHDAELETPAEEGLKSLQLANGMLMSEWLQTSIEIPLVSKDYQACLEEKIASSKLRKNIADDVNINMENSYR